MKRRKKKLGVDVKRNKRRKKRKRRRRRRRKRIAKSN